MKVFSFTDKGGRKQNQDCITYADISEKVSAYVLADGMGGYQFGDVAAKVVSDAIIGYVSSHYADKSPGRLLQEAFIYANGALKGVRSEYSDVQMGAVAVAAIVSSDSVSIAWLGDARAYVMEGRNTIFVTEDHSMINELKKAGTYKQSDHAKYSSCVSKCLMGDDEQVLASVSEIPLAEGFKVVLCSDGIHKEMDVESLPMDDDELRTQLNNLAPSMADNLSIIRITL